MPKMSSMKEVVEVMLTTASALRRVKTVVVQLAGAVNTAEKEVATVELCTLSGSQHRAPILSAIVEEGGARPTSPTSSPLNTP